MDIEFRNRRNDVGAGIPSPGHFQPGFADQIQPAVDIHCIGPAAGDKDRVTLRNGLLGRVFGAAEEGEYAADLVGRIKDALRGGLDRFAGQEEFYVKPVPELFAGVRILSGLTVLDDGSPVFLLDLNQLGQA